MLEGEAETRMNAARGFPAAGFQLGFIAGR